MLIWIGLGWIGLMIFGSDVLAMYVILCIHVCIMYVCMYVCMYVVSDKVVLYTCCYMAGSDDL